MSENRALQIGVVGLGQCGGNFAAELASREYPALAVNTSQTDLRSVGGLDDDQRIYIGLHGLNGTGGSLPVGADCVEQRGGEITGAVAGWPDVDAILAVGGLGGGTGGNLAALVELLAGDECPVIALGVLPSSSEGQAAKVNALQAVNGLLDAPFEALILVDNQKLYTAFANAGVDQFLQEGNRAVVAGLDELNRLSDRDDLSSIRSFDPQAFRHTLLSGGVVVFGTRDVEDPLASESLVDVLREMLADHEYLGSGYELEDAVVLSTVTVANADVLADTPATVFQDFNSAIKQESGGAAHHAGIYGGDVKNARLHVMVGGLPLPARTQELLEEAAEEAERFSTKAAPRSRLKKLDLSGLGALTGAPPSSGGKGMVKSKPGGKKKKKKKGAEEEAPLVDLDFEDEAVVEEELIDDVVVMDEVVEEEEI